MIYAYTDTYACVAQSAHFTFHNLLSNFCLVAKNGIGKCCDKYSIERFPKADELNVLEFLYTLNGKFIFIKEYEGILYESRGFIVAVVLKIRRYSLLV